METVNNLTLTYYLGKRRLNRMIYCLVNVGGKKWAFSINRTILQEHWDFEQKRVLPNNPEAHTINILLDQIRNNANECYLHLRMKKENVTLTKIKAMMSNKSLPSVGIIFTQYYNHKKMSINGSTRSKYKHYYAAIKSFIQAHYKENDINIDDVNRLMFVDNLYQWCRNVKTYSLAHTRKTIGFVKSIITYAVLHEYLDNNKIGSYLVRPYGEIKTIHSLNIQQLKLISEMNITNKMLCRVRDLFLFQCFTGLAYVDMVTLEKQHIKKDDNRYWIIKNRAKSGQISTIPIFPQAMAIIEKYAVNMFDSELVQHSSLFANKNGLLPCYTNQVFNRMLKEIGAYIGLDFPLTSHVARKTFGFIILNGGNVSIETVSAMLGHSNIKITQSIYAKVKKDKIEREMQDFDFFSGMKPISISA